MLKLTLVTPTKKIHVNEDCEEIFVPAFRGELNILPGHANLVTTLSTGILKYRLKGEEKLSFAAVSWGYCEVSHDNVNILAETAEIPKEIDIERAEAALKRAQEQLAAADASPEDIEKQQMKFERAAMRVEVSKILH